MAIVRPGTVQKSVLQVNETLTIATDANSSCRWGSLSPVPGSGLGANLDLPAAFVAVPASSSITVGPFAVATSIYIDFIAGPSVNITQVAAAPLPAHAGQPVDVVKLFGSAAPTAATGANIAAPGLRICRCGRGKFIPASGNQGRTLVEIGNSRALRGARDFG